MMSAQEIVESRNKPSAEFPYFGVKDFQPDGSSKQTDEIQISLSEIKNIISNEKVKVLNTLSQAVWHPELHLAEVTHQTGPFWMYMGHTINQKLYIFPEEALYLLETGSLQIFYNGVSLSVQRALSVLLNSKNSITVEKYRVYSILNNYGYKVRRHSPKNSVTKYEKKMEIHKLGVKLKNYTTVAVPVDKQEELINQSFQSKKKLKCDDAKSVEVFCSKFSNEYDSINESKNQPCISNYHVPSNLNFDYDIYLETSGKHSFKKSCLQLPNFRVVVHRSEDAISDLAEVFSLSNKYKDEIPVIHAVVFFDYIAFYQFEPVILPNPNE